MRTETDTRDAAARSRRLALFTARPEALMSVFGTSGLVRVKSTLPADSRVFEARYDADAGCFVVVVESAEFEPVPHGDRVPQIQSPLVTPVPAPALAAGGWELAVDHGSRLHGLLVNDRLALRPEQVIDRGARLTSVYRFESRADALRARQCLAGLPVTAEVCPIFGGAQPRD